MTKNVVPDQTAPLETRLQSALFAQACLSEYLGYKLMTATENERYTIVRTSLGPRKFVLDIGSSRHCGLIIAPGREANGGNLGAVFAIYEILVRLSLLTMTNPNQLCDVLLFVCSKMADKSNLSSKLPVANRTREI